MAEIGGLTSVDSTALVVPSKDVYAVISDVIEEIALEDLDAGGSTSSVMYRSATPRRLAYAVLTMENLRRLRGDKPHLLADIRGAFGMLVPEKNR